MFPHSRLSAGAVVFLAAISVVLISQLSFAQDDAPAAPFTGVSLKVANATVPPGGVYQVQLFLTEPKPLSHGSTTSTLPAGTGTATGISLNDPTGQAYGVALLDGNSVKFTMSSPDFALGTIIAYPMLTIAAPVAADALVGSQSRVTLDLGQTQFLDPGGQPYPQEVAPGLFTVGGNTSITTVVPGGGLVLSGNTVSILGVGFDPTSQVQINEVLIASTTFVSPNRIDVTLAQDAVMDARRIRVTTGAETVIYYSYLRTVAVGSSLRALLARTYPLFSKATYSLAALPWTRGDTQFTGLALQNPASSPAVVNLELLSSSNQVLQAFSITMDGRTKITRDLGEFFPLGFGGVSVRISASQPIQMLGLLGDTDGNIVAPVLVSGQ